MDESQQDKKKSSTSSSSSSSSHPFQSNSPRFMSATVASSSHKQVQTHASSTANMKSLNGRALLASAAKRVGIGRSSDEGKDVKTKKTEPVNKKKNPVRVVNLPDKMMVSAAPKAELNESCPLPKDKLLPAEKPLPSPPFLQLVEANPLPASRHLLDATERPLRRSPPGKPLDHEEDWPALSPEKLRSTSTSTVPPTGLSAHVVTEGTVSGLPRYPRRIVSDPTDDVSKVPVAIQHKVAPVSNYGAALRNINETHPSTPNGSATDSNPSDGSAKAAAVEKTSSGEKPRNFSLPRQTRTSSLRARISAGAVSTEGSKPEKKVVGFSEVTAVVEPGQPIGSAVSSTRRISNSPSAPYGRRPVKLDGRLHGYAPAKVIAGSRRPELQRPASRSGARSSQSHATSTVRERYMARKSAVKESQAGQKNKENTALKEIVETAPKGRSLIPVPQKKASSIQEGSIVVHDVDTVQKPASNDTTNVEASSDAFDIFEDNEILKSDNVAGQVKIEPIQASEVNVYPNGHRIKRLSSNCLNEGIVLSIDGDADRLIMGDGDLDKENAHPTKLPKKGKDLHRSVVTRELRKASASKEADERTLLKKAFRRSEGSQFSLHLHRSVSAEERQLKAHSADADAFTMMSTGEDPFVDARKQTKQTTFVSQHQAMPHVKAPKDTPAVETQHTERDMQHPSVEAATGAAAGAKEPLEKSPASATFPSTTIQEYLATRRVSPKHSHHSAGDSSSPEPPADRAVSGHTAPKDTSPSSEVDMDAQKLSVAPKGARTPPKEIQPQDLPPRSSSRITVPNMIKSSSSPVIAHTAAQHMNDTPSPFAREFAEAQKKLASANAPTKAPPAIPKLVAPPIRPAEVSSKPNVNAHKRASDASKLSQGSTTKSVLSMAHLRGLFRKTHTNNETKPAKPSWSRASNGSANIGGAPYSSATMPVNSGSKYRPVRPARSVGNLNLQPTPDILPQDAIGETTSLAMSILTSARAEQDPGSKQRLLEMGKVMVEAITNARDAEKAMEEAKVAAGRAELACAMARKGLLDVGRVVGEWKSDL